MGKIAMQRQLDELKTVTEGHEKAIEEIYRLAAEVRASGASVDAGMAGLAEVGVRLNAIEVKIAAIPKKRGPGRPRKARIDDCV